jgi:hypothetical protein
MNSHGLCFVNFLRSEILDGGSISLTSSTLSVARDGVRGWRGSQVTRRRLR